MAFSIGESLPFSPLNVFVSRTSPGCDAMHANMEAKKAEVTVVRRRVSSFASDRLAVRANS